jgi:hypothetical protein
MSRFIVKIRKKYSMPNEIRRFWIFFRRTSQIEIMPHTKGMDNAPKRSWPRARRPAGGKIKSHAELKRTSSIGYGSYRPSPPRGEGNIQFFGSEPTPAKKRKR